MQLLRLILGLRRTKTVQGIPEQPEGFLSCQKVGQLFYEIQMRSLKEVDLTKKLNLLFHWLERIRQAPQLKIGRAHV